MARTAYLILLFAASATQAAATTVQLSDVPLRTAVEVVLSQTSVPFILCDELAASTSRTSIRANLRGEADALRWLRASGLSTLGIAPVRVCLPPTRSLVYRPRHVPVSILRSTIAALPQGTTSDNGLDQKGSDDSFAFVGTCRGDECDRLQSTLEELDQPIRRAQLRLELHQVTLTDEELRDLSTSTISTGLTAAGAMVTVRGLTLTLQELARHSTRVYSQVVDLVDSLGYSSRIGTDVSYQDTAISEGVLTTTTRFLTTGTQLSLLPRFLSDGIHLRASLTDSTPTVAGDAITVASSSARADVVMKPGDTRTILQVADVLDGSARRTVLGIPVGRKKLRSSSSLVLVGTYL